MPTFADMIVLGAGGLAVLSALLVILMKDAIRSALFLVVTFFCLAVLYVVMNAQFIAAVQVIVYAGAIMVLFLFVIMLLNAGSTDESAIKYPVRKIVGILFAVLFLVQIASIVFAVSAANLTKGIVTSEAVAQVGHTQVVGNFLFSKYIYPFEAISILLLMAIIGSVVLAKRKL